MVGLKAEMMVETTALRKAAMMVAMKVEKKVDLWVEMTVV